MVPGIVQSKKAVFILIWSAIIHSFYVLPFVRTDALKNSVIYRGYILGISLMLYPLSGWLVDMYFSRYKAMLAGLLSVILGTTVSTILTFIYPKAVLGGFILVTIGRWLFEVNAIMYGFQQLELYSTENHRVFIYWFYWTLEIGHFIYGLCVCVSTQFTGAMMGSQLTSAVLGSTQVISMVIVAVIMLIFRHKFGDTHIGYHPLRSILSIIKQALQRPIGLEKLVIEKGGLHSREVISEVRTFLYIMSVILPLSVIYFTEEIFTVATQFRPDERNETESFQQCIITEVPTWIRSAIATTLIPMYLFLCTPIVKKVTHYKSLLVRMGVGLVIALFSTVSLFGIELQVFLNARDNSTIETGIDKACVNDENRLNYLWLIIPEVLNGLSVVIVFSTTLEFICAQSSSGIRGVLIGVWFALDGINKIFIATQEIWKLDCNVFYYVGKMAVVFVFSLIFVVAMKQYMTKKHVHYNTTVNGSYEDSNNGVTTAYYSSIDNCSDRDDYYKPTDSALSYLRK